jgi:hypothetical protein
VNILKKWWFWAIIIVLVLLFVPMWKMCVLGVDGESFCRFQSIAETVYREIFGY